ncbi:MAG: hypothetical protein MSA89_04610 [Clostridium sp.]|nr:hypothetical protein [Clostridium sp.]
MIKIIMNSGKEYQIHDADLNSVLFTDEKLSTGETVKVLRDEIIRIPKTNVLIRPNCISSLEEIPNSEVQ